MEQTRVKVGLDDVVPKHGWGVWEGVKNRDSTGKVIEVGVKANELGGNGDRIEPR